MVTYEYSFINPLLAVSRFRKTAADVFPFLRNGFAIALWLRYDVTGKSHLPATGTDRFRRYWRLESVRATHREH